MLYEHVKEPRKRPGTGSSGDNNAEWDLPVGRTPCDDDDDNDVFILKFMPTVLLEADRKYLDRK